MTTQDLIRSIFLRLSRYKLLIVLLAIAVAVLMFMYARSIAAVYTARASVFPLTASSDNSMANSALSSILGLTDAPKSFSQEATINIVELAQSRNTRESVVMERLPHTGNKRIAELLIENYNKTKSLFAKAIEKPTNEAMLAAVGGEILKNNMSAKINKNGIMEINFSSTNEALVSPVSYILIEKISQFYKDLKIKKAKLDYDFTMRKIDSLEDVLQVFDRRAVRMSNTTLFVPSDRLQYQIPKENLVSEKDRVMRQRDASANNREEALWRLQKVTPIIATLDKPDPPFDMKKPSSVMFALIGGVVGAVLAILLLISGLLYKYAKGEMYKAIFGDGSSEHVSTTL
jgi:hypothetical protein